MKITHTVRYGPRKAPEALSVTLTEDDLTADERSVAPSFWPMLLTIRAERQVIITKQGLGLFHKRAEENTRLAKQRADELDNVYKSILSLKQT